MEEKILRLLLSKIEDNREQIVQALADGRATEFAEYRHLCGIIRGLSLAYSEVNDLLRNLRECDNE